MTAPLLPYVLAQPSRRRIAGALLERPARLWSCSAMEEASGLSHATVFRTLRALRDVGMLRAERVNRRDLIYCVLRSPWVEALSRALAADTRAARALARKFAATVAGPDVRSIVLYGSAAAGRLRADSDIDILVILERRSRAREQAITNVAARLSSECGRSLSATILDEAAARKQRGGAFFRSVAASREVLYGRPPP